MRSNTGRDSDPAAAAPLSGFEPTSISSFEGCTAESEAVVAAAVADEGGDAGGASP
eukprot:CAMPEP_0185278140 /NCGR_PEP_ID=MMETSP1359-20130426/60292_1 /TAXON_ID=552665 /ORGANISM="Bigelowiella longifila, Strain CCMP242" /LENGTH=55 /DNA_ID=CAMNT_0027872531 /DNA_START=518 /DNA_END=683 /DNA_ORIENTATION=-